MHNEKICVDCGKSYFTDDWNSVVCDSCFEKVMDEIRWEQLHEKELEEC